MATTPPGGDYFDEDYAADEGAEDDNGRDGGGGAAQTAAGVPLNKRVPAVIVEGTEAVGPPFAIFKWRIKREKPLTVSIDSITPLGYDASVAIDVVRRIGQLGFENDWNIIVLRQFAFSESAGDELFDAWSRAVHDKQNPFQTHPLFAAGFLPRLWSEGINELPGQNQSTMIFSNPIAKRFLDRFAYDTSGVQVQEYDDRMRALIGVRANLQIFNALFRYPQEWVCASPAMVLMLGESKLSIAKYIRDGLKTGLTAVFPRLSRTGRPPTTMHVMIPPRHPDTPDLDIATQRVLVGTGLTVTPEGVPPDLVSHVLRVGPRPAEASMLMLRPDEEQLNAITRGDSIVVPNPRTPHEDEEGSPVSTSVLVPVERYGSIKGGTYYNNQPVSETEHLAHPNELDDSGYCGTFYYHAPGSSILLNCGHPPSSLEVFHSKYHAMRMLYGVGGVLPSKTASRERILNNLAREIFKLLVAQQNTYVGPWEYKADPKKRATPDERKMKYELALDRFRNWFPDRSREGIQTYARHHVDAIMSGQPSNFFKYLDPNSYRLLDQDGQEGKYVGDVLYAEEDVLDEELCYMGQELNVNVMMFTNMTGSHRAVSELLDTRNRSASYRNLVYVVV